MKKFAIAIVAFVVLGAMASSVDARCFGKGKVRSWLKSHRPHILRCR